MTVTDPRIVDAPALPGSRSDRRRDGDWTVIADLVNRAQAADGVEEVATAAGLAADYEPYERFRLERDVLIAEIDGKPVGMAIGTAMPRGRELVLEVWGAVAARAPAPRNRHGLASDDPLEAGR